MFATYQHNLFFRKMYNFYQTWKYLKTNKICEKSVSEAQYIFDIISRVSSARKNMLQHCTVTLLHPWGQGDKTHYQLVQGCNNVIIVRKIITMIFLTIMSFNTQLQSWQGRGKIACWQGFLDQLRLRQV